MFKGQGSPTVSPAIAATVLGMAFSSSFYQNAFLIASILFPGDSGQHDYVLSAIFPKYILFKRRRI